LQAADSNLQTFDSADYVPASNSSSPSRRQRHDSTVYSMNNSSGASVSTAGGSMSASANAAACSGVGGVYGLVHSTDDVTLPNRRNTGLIASGMSLSFCLPQLVM